MMKILYVISSTETGGAEKALYDLAISSQAVGNEVRVICLKPLGAVAELLQKAGIPVKSLAKSSRLPGGTIQQIRAEIASFQPDLVHAFLFRAVEYARLACAGTRVKLMVSPHFNLAKKSFWHKMIDRALKGRETLTVAESYSTANYLTGHQHYPKNKVFLLPNGVDKSCFYQDASLRKTMREKYGFHVKTVVFISVARLAPCKNPLVLLQAFRNVASRCPDVRLVYVGEGPERTRLEEYIRQSGLQQQVLLAGEQANVNSWLNMADVFVLPSLEESLPLALLEALQVGLPCIVSGAGDMPLWVEHGKNGYVCPAADITLLSCFMNELAADGNLRAKMSQRALDKAAQMGDVSQQYHQLYQQIVSNSFHVKTSTKE